ncbi:hypothetical protein [Christiangramia salexigens]|uniref:Membrane or secreted protein n=1 Tax=Christiangramia salexigens TaxID=1913577 RepID=A0A1L3J730_9FLAO|nr:hypothetical protein [Christiangramia salexigens]APG60945.1 hypothetical protein LPB144_11225 [Christiangramia salexigens]
MKSFFTFICLLFSFGIMAQSLAGSWKLTELNGAPITDKEIIRIYQDNYFAEGAKDIKTNEFLWAQGGKYNDVDYSTILDFHTKYPKLIGQENDPKLEFVNEDQIQINNVKEVEVWKRISDEENELSGNWVITGRKRDGEMDNITPGDRRTIKILAGDRFQWIAFNSATGEFFGTGGGTYTTEDGKYVENIDFFSRDNNRVGASLEFKFEVRNGEWHHSGKSSKGDPIYEIWSPYSDAYKIEEK